MPNVWDFLALLLVLLMLMGFAYTGLKMKMPFHLGEEIPISLSPKMLPLYAMETTLRMFIALIVSFIFTFTVGALAAKNERAGKVLIPIIDILQSVPPLGYLSVTVAAFISLFPGSLIGPECATIFVVFTSQVWNMTLSFYQSVRTVPAELAEATRVYQLSGWQRFWRLDVPFAMPGLLWNAMMSMSASWFFIVASEAISVANQTITLPGIGSYIALAVLSENLHAIFYAIITMLIVIFLYDQMMFRPLVAWSQKFRLGEMEDEETESWVLNLFQRAKFTRFIFGFIETVWRAWVNFSWINLAPQKSNVGLRQKTATRLTDFIWYGSLLVMAGLVMLGLWKFIYVQIPFRETWYVIFLGSLTALRVFLLIIICSVIWVPIGVAIGLRPKFARIAQPIAQFFAAFPANLFFPVFVILILRYHLNVEIWTAPLMILGTQWYILFNVIAGATNIPKELKLAAQNMQLSGWLKWKKFLLPAIFHYYVTGAITAAGGSWNASIVAEVINWGSVTLRAHGLGAYITENTVIGAFPQIALGVVVMCIWVTFINFIFWRRLYRFAEDRYRLSG